MTDPLIFPVDAQYLSPHAILNRTQLLVDVEAEKLAAAPVNLYHAVKRARLL